MTIWVLLNSCKLAAATANGVVHLFDGDGDRRDKFKTKAADGAAQPVYAVRALAYSPDSVKLAVAQVKVQLGDPAGCPIAQNSPHAMCPTSQCVCTE